ncbi:transmembrane secretion effector [Paraburkholderia fungorum]|nr:transmembrane secretion effector [Paraburkholderia fungorum]
MHGPGPTSGDLDHAVYRWNIRTQLSDLYLNNGRRCFSCRCTRLRPARLGHGDRHGNGALLAAGRGRPRFTVIVFGAGVFCMGCTLAAVAPTYWVFACTLAVIGVAALTFTNTTNSLMQLSAEPAMRGRIMALRLAIALGGTPIGAPVVGWVANHLSPWWALGVGAAAGFVAASIGVFAVSQAVREQARLPNTDSR